MAEKLNLKQMSRKKARRIKHRGEINIKTREGLLLLAALAYIESNEGIPENEIINLLNSKLNEMNA